MGNKNFVIRPFEKLQKQLNCKEAGSAPRSSGKVKKEYTEEELFSSAMEDVQAIEAFRALSCERSNANGKTYSPAIRRDQELEGRDILTAIADGRRPINLPDTQEYVELTNPDYASIIKEQLQEGRFSVQTFLDLHGCTVPQAEGELDAFLDEAFTKGFGCVKIIHGRGLRSPNGPRIKEAVVRRLLRRYRKQIIACTSARQCDGGLGALYVLLLRNKNY